MAEPSAIQQTRGTVRAMLRAFDSIGLDADAIYAAARPTLHGAPIEGAEGAPPFLSEMFALWEAARRATGESGFGVRLSELVQPGDGSLFGRLLQSASTLGEALMLASRSMRLVANSMQMSVHVSGERASVAVVRLFRAVPHDESVEYALGSLVRLSRVLAGAALPLTEVTFTHERPPDTSHQARVFSAPLHYGAAQSAYFFDSAQLLIPLRTGNLTLRRKLEHAAKQALTHSADPADFQREVRAAIERELQRGDASQRRVAARVGLHPKALSRRLAAQRLTFRGLLEGVRYALADRYLRAPEARVGRVALALGYSEKSAFNRAFKRWSGRSPQAFRRELGLSAADPGEDER